MLDFIIWIVIIALFVLSFVGILYPIIPSVLVLWVGFLLYQFIINANELTASFWIVMVIFTIFLFVADILANSYFVKKYGGSKWGERGAAIAVIVGSFIVPPFGIIIVPFITVFLVELIQKRTPQESARASVGSLLGFLGGSAAKVLVQLVMIFWFFVVIIF
ncbi:DUF456 domain-containing protein [Oceanobacillus halophilus]|uniref:DUF456 domain-containing protein n=1 Tax=Oceanobacillus halophilus TaxID=930130 RepID=A0A495A005_9BACI|nr:DUF456 domain-containing protein [Oceanobacillus halophilus]RKQ30873.1 DUF456 domain-containing protein [Oceanobacillus halophilus]